MDNPTGPPLLPYRSPDRTTQVQEALGFGVGERLLGQQVLRLPERWLHRGSGALRAASHSELAGEVPQRLRGELPVVRQGPTKLQALFFGHG